MGRKVARNPMRINVRFPPIADIQRSAAAKCPETTHCRHPEEMPAKAMSLLVPLAWISAAVTAPTSPQCAIPLVTYPVERIGDLPEAIRSDLLRDGPVAEPDQDFNDIDLVRDPNLPHRRLVQAGRTGGEWFVWLDHGGSNRHADVIGYRQLWETNQTFRWYRAAELQGEACVAINAFLHGVWTATEGQR
jgi:hypothetical protein